MAERHVLGLSGGKDSAALAIFMRETYPELDIEYFFTDTGKELPEVYAFLNKLEGFLGKPILKLNPHRGFDFWLKEYNHFLPSPQTRWCTRQLKLLPFEQWVRPMLADGDTVYSYVAIRADEEYRTGYSSTNNNLIIKLPFREKGINKEGVRNILANSGVGWPEYYKWRSRSGCTFCFFQKKIEWIGLLEKHPDEFQKAKKYEKLAIDHGSPFTWIQGEPLSELEKPERITQIKDEFQKRLQKEKKKKPVNPLLPEIEIIEIDDLYYDDEGAGSCNICHK
ncbi:phosphoadenosine phosphosulfate reductase family protein [Gilliamella sp. BG1]|uniref:phosphoadenosine phosphosulfate reductase domain-containing protein n=1 Tax=Gilliamella sp. BG1 TaxID=3351508 RepID=UPI00398832F1